MSASELIDAMRRGCALRRRDDARGQLLDYRFSRHMSGAFHEDGWRRAINLTYALLPGRLRPGITMVRRAIG